MDSNREKEKTITTTDYYNTPRKLSLPIKRPSLTTDAPTPPPRTAALSVPFKWEEAPGKPRPCHTRSKPIENVRTTGAARALELPPRLLSSLENVASPTTVLEGPYVGRAVSFTTSNRGGCNSNSNNKETTEGNSINFGSSRWLKKESNNRVERDDNDAEEEGSFDFSSWTVDGSSKVKISRVRRKGSFSTLSNGSSHLWARIYGSFKQVVPWKRRQEKQGPKTDTV